MRRYCRLLVNTGAFIGIVLGADAADADCKLDGNGPDVPGCVCWVGSAEGRAVAACMLLGGVYPHHLVDFGWL